MLVLPERPVFAARHEVKAHAPALHVFQGRIKLRLPSDQSYGFKAQSASDISQCMQMIRKSAAHADDLLDIKRQRMIQNIFEFTPFIT